MADDSEFSAAQKLAVSGMPGWKLWAIHSNGDVTVIHSGNRIRLTKEGKIVGQMEMLEPSVKKAPIFSAIKVKEPKYKKFPGLTAEQIKEFQRYDEYEKAYDIVGLDKQGNVTYTSDTGTWLMDTTGEMEAVERKAKSNPEIPSKKIPKSTHWGEVTSFKTVCQEHPACCKPRKIKGVFLDADHTIWDLSGTAAGVTGPIKLIDENTVVEMGHDYGTHLAKYSKWNIEDYMSKEEKELLKGLSADEKDFLLDEMAKEHNAMEKQPETKGTGKETVRTTIKLDPTFRPLVAELKKRNIPMAVISLNTPGSVKRIFREFGLEDAFVEIRDSYENKGKVFHEMTNKMGICACDALFLDDNRTNVQDVGDKCGISLQIGPGKDIEKIGDLLKFVED